MHLMTLAEVTQTTPMETLAAGTQIPAATLDEIYAWYHYRLVCDNDRFATYFNRQLKLLERQYLLYLRNDMTTWDPMVVDYIERQLTVDEKATTSSTSDGTNTTKRTGTVSHETSGQDVIDTSGNNDNTRTLGTKTTTNGTSKLSGQDTVGKDQTRTDNLTHTRNTTDTRTDDTTSSGTESGMTNEISDAKRLDGSTPDSSMYGTGSNIGLKSPDESMPEVLHETGAPDKLNWSYTGSQSESITQGDRVTRGVSETKNTGTVTTIGTGSTMDTGTVITKETDTTNYGRTQTDNNTVDETGTITDKAETTGQQTTKYGRVLTDTNDMTDSQTTNGTEKGESSRDTTHRERYSGRHESPTELLRKAQAYIVGSNSLKWLLNNLETCFFQVWEAW